MNLLLMVTYRISLQKWYNLGIIYRQFEVYMRLVQKNLKSKE